MNGFRFEHIGWAAVSVAHLAASLSATAECITPLPRYVEMRVESCVSAVPLAESAILGKDYSLPEAQAVKVSAANIYVIHAKALADMDLVEWYSRDGFRRYRAKRAELNGEARDYLVVSYVGCEQFAMDKSLLFDANASKPCRDSIAIVNGREPKETEASLILDLPMVSYVSGQEEIEDVQSAVKRLQVTCEAHSPEASR